MNLKTEYSIGSNGEWKLYHESGKLMMIGMMVNGKPNGECKFYHENGQVSGIGKYQNGEQTGEWKYYDENGKLKRSEKF